MPKEDTKEIGELIQKRQEAKERLEEARRTAGSIATKLDSVNQLLVPLQQGYAPSRRVVGQFPTHDEVSAVIQTITQQYDIVQECTQELKARGIDC